MRIAVILFLSLFAPLPFMGILNNSDNSSLSFGAEYEVQRFVTSSSEIELIKDDIILRLNPAYPVDDPTEQSSDYGYRLLSDCNKCSRYHQGVDYPLSEINSNVYAVMDGVVVQVQRSGEYGIHVIIEHVIYPDELVYSTIYAHLRQSHVTKSLSIGDRVQRGQLIGYIGSTGLSTGPHLHFEVHKNGENINPAEFFATHVQPDSNS